MKHFWELIFMKGYLVAAVVTVIFGHGDLRQEKHFSQIIWLARVKVPSKVCNCVSMCDSAPLHTTLLFLCTPTVKVSSCFSSSHEGTLWGRAEWHTKGAELQPAGLKTRGTISHSHSLDLASVDSMRVDMTPLCCWRFQALVATAFGLWFCSFCLVLLLRLSRTQVIL